MKKTRKNLSTGFTSRFFTNVVKPIISIYMDKMTCGFSLVAYYMLYFASLLDCSLSHIAKNINTSDLWTNKNHTKFNIDLPENKNIDTIFVYDLTNAIDKHYIEEGVLPQFANAILIKIPYGDLGLDPQMLLMGILKEFVLAFMK